MLARDERQLIGTVLRAKVRIARNHLRGFQKHWLIHGASGVLMLLLVVGGGFLFFHWLFMGLLAFEPFGPLLMDRLAGLVFFSFFGLLLFSNIVITLSTTYISEEIEFHMQRPLDRRVIFSVKFVESTIFSSWAFMMLALPLFLGLGTAKDAPLSYHIGWMLLIIPFIALPAALGSLVTMLIAALLPARRTRVMTVLLALLGIAVMGLIGHTMGLRPDITTGDEQFTQMMSFLSIGSHPLLPSHWMNSALIAATEGDLRGFAFWWLMLTTSALMAMQICLWAVPTLFYRGWCLARESASSSGEGTNAFTLFPLIDFSVRWLPRHIQAFFRKDARTFWRDPAQWFQLVMLFGLLFLYVVNIRYASSLNDLISSFVERFQNAITFFNLGVICAILSILSTRFVYPMLSLEGKQFWVVGLAPINRTSVVWQKYWLCFATTMLVSSPLLLLSGGILQISHGMLLFSFASMLVIAFGLASLTVGLGAALPNFAEDNPAWIANGLGGTMCIIFSLLHIAVTTLMLFVPARLMDLGTLADSTYWQRFGVLHIAAIVVINLAVMITPMAIGLRRWKAMDL